MELSKLRLNAASKIFSSSLEEKIINRKANVGVIGVGYVGQTLIHALINSGFRTVGFDLDASKAKSIEHKLYVGVDSAEKLEMCEVIVICVPTPLSELKKPDLSFLRDAVSNTAKFKTKNQIVIVESTVAPGTLRNIILPYFLMEGKTHGKDFFLAISPERVDPGNQKYSLSNTPRVVAGLDEEASRLATLFYSGFVEELVVASNPEVAELTKMIENTFRLVNISLVNEIKEYADSIGVDIWEAINAASTKPYAFMAHFPGPGVGGHCIPVDPVYLLEEARNKGFDLSILESAVEVNRDQPKKIVAKAKEMLNGRLRERQPKMLVIGIAYKPGTSDTRESPAVKIIERAETEGFEVSYYDPFVPRLNGHSSQILSMELIEKQDIIIIATHHKNIQYELIRQSGVPTIDTRNILKEFEIQRTSTNQETNA